VHKNEWWSFGTSALTLFITYLNKWFFLESPFLLFYFEVIIFYNCQVLMLMTDKPQQMFISENVKIPVVQTFY
jgi:hypothetical protein